MSDYLKSIAGWNSDGSLGLHWMERDMANGARSVNGFATARCAAPQEMTKFAQAVITQTTDGQWKVFVQSDNQVEDSFVGDFESVMFKLREYRRSDWHRRS